MYSMYARMYVCVYVCTYVHIHSYIYVYVHTYTDEHLHRDFIASPSAAQLADSEDQEAVLRRELQQWKEQAVKVSLQQPPCAPISISFQCLHWSPLLVVRVT